MFKHAPWASHDEGDEKKSEEQSLSTILDSTQRGELTLLLASATSSMRKVIEDTFDPSQTEAPDFVGEMTGLSDEEKIMNPNIDTGTVDVEAYDKQRKEREQRAKEVSAPKMKELKDASLKFFDEWSETVLQRVGEVVNSKETAVKQQQQAKPSKAEPTTKRLSSETEQEGHVATALHDLYPPISTSLESLPEEKRMLILHSTLLLLLSLEHYIAHSRVLLLYLTSSLKLPVRVLAEDETKIAKGLLEAAKQMSGEEEIRRKAEENKDSRKWKVGLASVAGAAIIGVTGGLAAPLVAAGIGGVMGGLGLGATAAAGYLGTLAGSTVLVGGLFGAYGGRMTGQMMDNYAREVEDFAFLPVRGTHKKHEGEKEEKDEKDAAKDAAKEDRRLRVTIGISGWLTEKEEIVTPWRVIGKDAEVFALRWELEALMHLGNSLNSMVSSAAWGYAQNEIIKRTIFASLASAMWPLGLLKVSRIVDNPFSVAKSRAEKAGAVLADALINKAQGERPVTLVGYSLGARVIYACVKTLAERKAFGLVESVVLIGAPVPADAADWRIMRTVVAGRLINVFSEHDYILGFLYRTSSIQYGVAGLQKVEGMKGIENIDVSKMVTGHLRYRYLVGSILEKIGFEDIEMGEVMKEQEALKLVEEEEERERKKQEEKVGKEGAEEEAKDLEKKVEQKQQRSMMQIAAEKLRISR
ncbi:MAG: hypothetical protein M1835_006110 [Candelina submexicana]|nr:MAG: hypothetical protein M1835_006110 [Candelina submexicana]